MGRSCVAITEKILYAKLAGKRPFSYDQVSLFVAFFHFLKGRDTSCDPPKYSWLDNMIVYDDIIINSRKLDRGGSDDDVDDNGVLLMMKSSVSVSS